MKYDFTTKPDRVGKDAIAVDMIGKGGMAPDAPKDGFSLIPMWVADMNFLCFPGIRESIAGRLAHPAFGYFSPRKEYYDSIISWQAERNRVEDLAPEFIGYENGVVGGVVSALNAVCAPCDHVLVHSPTYVGFTMALKKNGYSIIHSPLVKDGAGIWRMDFDDMEEKIRSFNIKALIFCSPHNPCGRVWEEQELVMLSDLCEKYGVTVISDEIWSDIIMPGHRHIPTQSATDYLKENTAALYAPSKTFNLAGLVGSYRIIYGKRLREAHEKQASLSSYNNMNVLSMYALTGAYTKEGMNWTDQMCGVINENINTAMDFIDSFEGVSAGRPEGTYMLFADCEKWCARHGKSMDEIEKACWNVGVALQDGRMFHGNWSLRINLALPHQYVEEAFERLKMYVFTD